jgi:hypothetical protein
MPASREAVPKARAGAEFEDGAAGLGGREGGEEPAVFRRRGHGEALGGGPAPESPGELGHRASSWPAVASTWLGTGTKGWGLAFYDPATETYEPF